MQIDAKRIWGSLATDPDEIIRLWPGVPPGGENIRLTLAITERSTTPDFKDRAATGIAQPQLTVFRPEHPDGSALIIAPGGNYIRVVLDKEGFESGRLLRGQGVTVFVLRYRLPFDGWHSEAPLEDAQRAIRLVRARAKEFAVDPARIGMVGFSAGGHVAASLATCHAQKTYAPVDDADAISARPDFAALFYPIITMLEPHVLGDGRDAVLGKSASPEKRARFSRELCVDADTPPCFLMAARDDAVIPVGNTQVMADALQAANVPAEVHIFEKGGHGFGIRLATGKPVAIWPELFLNWGRAMGYFGPARSTETGMTKYSDEELAARVKSPGWGLTQDGDTGTLEEMLKTAHHKRQGNDLRGGIRELETAIELDMIQIEKLWLYLGLPV